MNFPSQIFFNDINHGYRAAILKKSSLWLLPSYIAVATSCYYEKVCRTMGTAIVSYLLNLINHEPDIDKIYLYAKDPHKAKYQLLINKRENIGLKYFNDSKAFIEYSNDMNDVKIRILKNIIQMKKRKILIVFDDMITDMLSNKKLCKSNSN